MAYVTPEQRAHYRAANRLLLKLIGLGVYTFALPPFVLRYAWNEIAGPRAGLAPLGYFESYMLYGALFTLAAGTTLVVKIMLGAASSLNAALARWRLRDDTPKPPTP